MIPIDFCYFVWYLLYMSIPVKVFIYSEAQKIEFGDSFYRLIVYSDVRGVAMDIAMVVVKYHIFCFVDV